METDLGDVCADPLARDPAVLRRNDRGRTAPVVEDSINYIARDNPDAKVHADIQLKRDTDSVQIVIVDDGRTYNPIPGLAEATLDKPGALEAVIVMGLSAVVNYDRVLDLNILSLDLDPAAGVRQPG